MPFFKEIEEVAAGSFAIHAKYAMLRDIFKRIVNQALSQTSINFIGLFAKVDYLMKQLDVPTDTAQLIHNTRRMLNAIHTTSENELTTSLPYDVARRVVVRKYGTHIANSLLPYYQPQTTLEQTRR